MEQKEKKKAWTKGKRKACRPWKGLTVFTAILMVVCMIATFAIGLFDNTISIFIGGNFWTLENKDENAMYFTSDFASKEEKIAYEDMLGELVEAEGAALLMNKDNALPLSKGDKVSTFSNSSVNLVYGGTGSGSIDVATAANLISKLMMRRKKKEEDYLR